MVCRHTLYLYTHTQLAALRLHFAVCFLVFGNFSFYLKAIHVIFIPLLFTLCVDPMLQRRRRHRLFNRNTILLPCVARVFGSYVCMCIYMRISPQQVNFEMLIHIPDQLLAHMQHLFQFVCSFSCMCVYEFAEINLKRQKSIHRINAMVFFSALYVIDEMEPTNRPKPNSNVAQTHAHTHARIERVRATKQLHQ